MIKQVLKMSSILSLVVALAVTAVSANPTNTLKANIPFDFSVGGRTLPAGVYTVTPMSMPNTLRIRRDDNREGVLIQTEGSQTRRDEDRTKLVFRRYGDQHFLAQVWTAEDGTMCELRKSRAERELMKSRAKFLAKSVAEPEVVSILVQ
jgi:hypothetical protein